MLRSKNVLPDVALCHIAPSFAVPDIFISRRFVGLLSKGISGRDEQYYSGQAWIPVVSIVRVTSRRSLPGSSVGSGCCAT
jgi:hypothetical protein